MERENAFRRRIAAHLESRVLGSAETCATSTRFSPTRRLADAWAAHAVVERSLVWDSGTKLVTVGGARLGGSGKTRLATSIVARLADAGITICLLGHAYKAHPGVARAVRPEDDVGQVGDEALAAARRLATRRAASVAVGPTRQAALDFAVRTLGAKVVVVDGLLQTSPTRADLALLALDADDASWSSGASACPPLGDLRASVDRLRAATDLVVSVPVATASLGDPASIVGPVGLVTALARPDRIERCLAGMGIEPRVHVALGDHARPSRLDRARLRGLADRHGLTAWIATDKCAASLEKYASSFGAPLVTLVPDFAALPVKVEDALAELLCGQRPQRATSIEP